MNKNCYRIIFNKARGMLMAVAETTAGRSKGSNATRGPRSSRATTAVWATLRPLMVCGLSALGLVWLSPSHAQVVADPGAPANQRPQVGSTANGVPLVNIRTPSAAGVSRNTYKQFDVQQPGVILNNARTNAQTQLGGWVQGNPNLAGGSARVILNEVTSSHPSFLRGYVEVAGSRAEVIIANPAGIQCDGCGFINADRSTLTTGTPVFGSGGHLDGFRVEGGLIAVSGAGLDASDSNYTDLIARSVQVNAGIWAKQLKVTAGANVVDVANTHATPIAGTGAAPAFGIDVAHLGGMYAGKITLVGTEAGVGVRNAGTIGASAGNVLVTADGLLQNSGTLAATDDIRIDSQAMMHTGVMGADGDISISLQADYVHTHAIQAGGNLSFHTTAKVTNRSALLAGQTLDFEAATLDNTADGEITGHTTRVNATTVSNEGLIDGIATRIEAKQLHNVDTGRIYGDHVAINADQLSNESGAVIGSRDRLDIGAITVANLHDALLFSAGDMVIGGMLDESDNASGTADHVLNEGSTIEALVALAIDAKIIENRNADLATQTVVIDTTKYDQFRPRDTDVRLNSADYPEADIGNFNISRRRAGPYSFREYWRWIYTGTTTEEQVVSSKPGNILAGTDIHLHGDVVNSDSHIIAGNALTITGGALNNSNTAGSRITTYRGHVYYYDYDGNESCGDPDDGCYDISKSDYNPADAVTTFNLPTTTVAEYTAPTGSGTDVADATVPVPPGGFFQANPDPAGSYLIETDPRFADYREWLSSDYMLQQLALDPTLAQKRLGDGFYEQRLIREQVGQLTGRRFLDGYANDEAQYQALMNAGVTVASELQLVPGIALSAEQIAQLTSDIVWLIEKDVKLPDGTLTRALVPQVYVQVKPDDLQPTTGLLAGNTVDIQVSGNLSNGGTIAGRELLTLDADNIRNLGGTLVADTVLLNATRDIEIKGGSVVASDALIAEAGNDITLRSTTQSSGQRYGASRFTRTNVNRIAGLYVTGDSGLMLVSAGNDVTLDAATIVNRGVAGETMRDAASTLTASAVGATLIQAGRDIKLGTVTIAKQNNSIRDSRNYIKDGGAREIGTTIDVVGDLALNAEQDVSARAATVRSEAGAIDVAAGRDITVDAGRETSTTDDARYVKKSGTFSSTIKTYRNSYRSDSSIGSSFSGETVSMQAGRDIGVEGSNVVSTHSTTLLAGRDISIEAATDTHAETHFKKEKTSGFFSSGGLSLTYGSMAQSGDNRSRNTYAASSTVGSVEGDVTIRAGEAYKQVGSDVLAPQGDIDIAAKKVDIVEARETGHATQEHKFKQSGITVSVTSPVVSAVQTAEQMYQASKETDDSRIKTLAAGMTAFSGYNAYSALEAGQGATINGKDRQIATGTDAEGNATSRDANAADKVGGINISISVGSSKSSSKSQQTSNTAAGSAVAGHDVTITATGAGDESNLTVRGSSVTASNDLKLKADDAINLVAAQNIHTQDSSDKGSSASVGFGFALGGSQNGFTINAGVSAQRGNADGKDVTHTHAKVTAGDKLTVESGSDTNLKGAVVSGKQVVAQVGGDLSIDSLQDTSAYESEQKSGGISVSLCIPPLCYGASSGSVNYSQAQAEGDYASVTEQSGIKAGDGGFQITVEGNTDLTGAVIASTDKAIQDDKNILSTGTLTTSDISNHAEASASSSGFGISSDMLTQGKYGLSKAIVSNALGNASASEDSSGRTKAAVSVGTIVITDETQQVALTGTTAAETVAALNRDVGGAHVAADKLDVKALESRVEAEKFVKQESIKIAALFTDEAYRVSFVKRTKVYNVERDPNTGEIIKGPDGQPVMAELTNAEKLALRPPPGEKLNVFTNGIFNDLGDAGGYAVQMSELPPGQDVYLIYYPEAKNVFSELLVAGYQKFLEGNIGDLANATHEMKRIFATYGAEGLNAVGHSRGAMTIGNAMEALASEGEIGALTNTDIKFVGPAYSAQEAANLLNHLSNGLSSDMQLQNHADDFVGTIIGENPVTYDQRPGNSSLLNEWLRMFGDAPTVHSCYGTGAVDPEGCGKHYGIPTTVNINANGRSQ